MTASGGFDGEKKHCLKTENLHGRPRTEAKEAKWR